MNREINYTIEEHIGILSENERTGWRKELNRVSWNGGPTKYDIRDWSPDHDKMSRGLTLKEEEAVALCQLLVKDLKTRL